MSDTPIADALRAHLAEHPGDIDAIVDALARVEALVPERDRHALDAVPEWPLPPLS